MELLDMMRKRGRSCIFISLGVCVTYACMFASLNFVINALWRANVTYQLSVKPPINGAGVNVSADEWLLHDLTTQVTGMRRFLTPYLRELEGQRKSMLSPGPWKQISESPIELEPSEDNFFLDVRKFPQIKTLTLRAKWKDMKQFLIGTYYNFATTNCEMLRKLSKGFEVIITVYGTECVEEPEETIEALPPNINALSIGLPYNFALPESESNEAVIFTYIQMFRHAAITTDGNVISGRVKILYPKCFFNPNGTGPFKEDPVDFNKAPFYEEIFTIAQNLPGFYHGTAQELPRIVPYLSFLWRHKNIKIHVRWMFRRFLTEVLAIPDNRIITGPARARVVYSPAGMPCGYSSLFPIQYMSAFMRLVFVHLLDNPPPLRKRDVIVLVKRHEKRWFAHHDAIKDMLDSYAQPRGMFVYVFDDLPVPGPMETGLYFGRALMIVAPHGAGETNIVLSEPGTILLEGMCLNDKNGTVTVYRDMAVALGLRYFGAFFPGKECIDITAQDLQMPVARYFDLYDHGLLD